jgi:hypothetical protein
LYCLCVTAAQLHNFGWNRRAFTAFFETALPLGAGCILLYSLFFLSFSSQAGGIVPSGVFVTRPVQFFIMFGFFLIPVLCYQFGQLKTFGTNAKRFGLNCALAIFAVLFLLESIIFVALIMIRTGKASLSAGNRMNRRSSGCAGRTVRRWQ